MQSITRLFHFCWKLSMTSFGCHSGRGGIGIAGRSWAFELPGACSRRGFGVFRLVGHSTRFGHGCYLSAVLGRQRSSYNRVVIDFQGVPDCRRSSMKGNFSVAAFSESGNFSEEMPNEDLATFRPPPPAAPVTPQELLAEVPFHYWYSYADLPDNSSSKRKTRKKELQESKRFLTTKSMDSSDSLSLQPERSQEEMPVVSRAQAREPRYLMREPKELSNSTGLQTYEPRTSATGEITEHLGLSNQMLEGPTKSVTRKSSGTAGSTLNPGEQRRSLMREPRGPSGLYNPRRSKGVAEMDAAFKLSSGRTRGKFPEIADVQQTTGISSEVERFGKAEQGTNSVRNASGELDEDYECITPAAPAEGFEKVAFRLSKKEINLLVDICNRSQRQINMGWRGWGHNYITLVHSYWKKSEVCKIKCKGAVTLDMDFLCNKLEEKTGGRVIHRNLGVVYLYRGREYDPKFVRKLPVMHQRKKTPAKRLPIPFGLTKDDVNALRARGKELPALCKLARNGVYVTLLDDIRKEFEKGDLVRVNCQGLEARNFRTLGVKLKKLVPCVLISYEFEHILMWRWDGYKVPSPGEAAIVAEESFNDDEADIEQ